MKFILKHFIITFFLPLFFTSSSVRDRVYGMKFNELLEYTKSCISCLLKNRLTIKKSKVVLQEKMKPTFIRLTTHYKPSIKFIGKRHSFAPKSATGGKLMPHPCSPHGILPGSSECIPVHDLLKNQLPLIIKPYVVPIEVSKDSYSFVSRPLEPNEVDSVFKLPSKYRFKPIELDECEIINGGGVL